MWSIFDYAVQGMQIMGTSKVLAGGGIPAINGAGMFTLQMNAGDVAEVIGDKGNPFESVGTFNQLGASGYGVARFKLAS